MDLMTILDMTASGLGERVLVGPQLGGLTGCEIREQALRGANIIRDRRASAVVYLGANSPSFPVSLFAAAAAHVPFLPVNYRLGSDQLRDILTRRPHALLITDNLEGARALAPTLDMLSTDDFLGHCRTGEVPDPAPVDPDSIAVVLMTSGTTAAAKGAVLRHSHLASYVFGTSEFASAEPTDAAIVSVPPYHVAAVANLLSSLYSGRRIVYLDHFTPADWLALARSEQITSAMVVPTMLARIVRHLDATGESAPPSLTSISYGGAKLSVEVLERALALFPDVGFVNAYGLTETSSSIALLGPEDHRAAAASADPTVRARLGSVGRALPNVTIEVHDGTGAACEAGVQGEIVVTGPQISGEYLEGGVTGSVDGWFHTRDAGYLDADGYLFVRGRLDDTIIRGGENIAPASIEEVLGTHPDVQECAVVGIPDEEWGQRIAAFIVREPGRHGTGEELKRYLRERLRKSMTPDFVVFVDELPTTATGKVLRRALAADFAASA